MRLPVWIIIVFTFIGTFIFLRGFEIHGAEIVACYGTDQTCAYYSMQCPNDHRINVERLRYGLAVGSGMSCRNDIRLNCSNDDNKCCAKESDNCIVDYPDHQAESVRNNCSGKPSCGPIHVNFIMFNTSDNCNGQFSNYGIVNYSCRPGTNTTVQLTSTTNGPSSPGNKSFSSGKSQDGISVAAIIGVVIAAIVVIAVVAVVLIIFKRRQKKSTKGETLILNLPKELTNHVHDRSVEVGKNGEVVEPANYDVISDESVLNCSLPEKDKKDTTTIPVTVDEYSDVSTDEYDQIQFKMKGAMKASNHDRLAALKGKIGDDSYSHVSNGSKSVTIATCTVNDYSHCAPNSKDTLKNGDDYSHCKPNSKDTLGNGDDYSHCKPNGKDTLGNGDDYSHCKPNSKDTLRNGDDYSHCKPYNKDTLGNGDDYSHCKPISKDTLGNGDDYSHCKPYSKDTLGNGDDYSHCKPNCKDTLRNGDDYSRAVLERDCTIKPESDINEEDSYNHIDFDDTKHPM